MEGRTRAIVVLLGTLVIAFAASALAGAAAPSPSGPHAGEKRCKFVTKKVRGKKVRVKVCAKRRPTQPSAAVRARQLATQVTQASDERAREQALVTAMRALAFRVYSSEGRVVVPGAGDLARDVYLYDVTLKAIAGGLARGETTSLAEFAQRLSAAGVTPEGRPLTADELRSELVAGARAAVASPKDRYSLVPLLARELGLRHRAPYDLAQDVPAERLRLDPLQTLLVTVDLLAAATRQQAFTRALRAPAAASSNPCDSAGATAAKEVMPAGKWTLGLVKKLGAPLRLAGVIIDLIHGPALALSVRVTWESPASQEGHYGPAGHRAKAGEPLRFRVKVEMLDDYGEIVVKCGGLIGMKFPKKGPIPGVTIHWSDAEGELGKHGTLAYEPADKKTGSDGIGTLVFTPKGEALPGIGIEKSERGVVQGVALYQSAFGNLPGSIAQFLTPKFGTGAWEVAFHDSKLLLDVEASIKGPGDFEPTTARVKVQGLELAGQPDGTITGERALQLLSYHVADSECWTHTWSASPAAPFRVLSFAPGFTQTASGALTANPTMRIDPGKLSEAVTHHCDGESYTDERNEYVSAMAAFFPTATVDGWTYVGGADVWARKTISGSAGEYTGTITFELRLAPGS